jgi:hypothetical protein
MCRIAAEAYIFPLVGQFAIGRSPHLDTGVRELKQEGYR